MPASKDEYLQESSHTIIQLIKDKLLCSLLQDHEKYYEDLLNLERLIELVRIEHKRIARDFKTTLEIRDTQIQALRAELEALKTQNQQKN